MSNLFQAGFLRLKRDKLFWCMAGLMAVSAAFLCVDQYSDIARYRELAQVMPENEFYAEVLEEVTDLGTVFFQWAAVIGQAVAVFASVYVGTEYSDGTIRNKVMAGHKRSQIYLSNFWISALGGVVLAASFMGAALLVGLPLFSWRTGAPYTAFLLLEGLLETVAFAAICNLVSMLVPNRTYGLVVNLFVIVVLALMGIAVMNMLAAPEMITQPALMVDGVPVPNEVPNPRYLSGAVRELFHFILDVLPSGQGYQIANREVWRIEWMWLYSVIVTLVVNGVGCVVFRRKDLK